MCLTISIYFRKDPNFNSSARNLSVMPSTVKTSELVKIEGTTDKTMLQSDNIYVNEILKSIILKKSRENKNNFLK